MKRAIGSIGGSWGISLMMVMEIIPIPDDSQWISKLLPYAIIAIGHVYGGI